MIDFLAPRLHSSYHRYWNSTIFPQLYWNPKLPFSVAFPDTVIARQSPSADITADKLTAEKPPISGSPQL